ncbi:hypothetical protein [Streptomyces acidicola]|uniref:hypothetical protein n=1 Tax=Streptomyces acidicola TaxID=2596892 RepID=UPI003438BBC8
MTYNPANRNHPDLELVAQPRLYFNAARLDRSLTLSGSDYARVAKPQVERIAERTQCPPGH